MPFVESRCREAMMPADPSGEPAVLEPRHTPAAGGSRWSTPAIRAIWEQGLVALSHRARRPEVKWLLAAALFARLAQFGHAQREGAPVGVESVFLDTDAAAAKKLGAARDLIAARQWGDGIDLVRQIAEQHGDRMVAIGPQRYVCVATYCDILLSSLPEAGLKLYRSRTDAQAKRWYEGARAGHDEQGLHKVVHRAFLSSYGDDALLLLGQLAWERGNLPQARSYWEQLLPLEQPTEPGQLPPVLRYPSSKIDTAQIRARLVLCSLMQGQLQRGQRELADFRRLHPQAVGSIAGQKGNLGEILAAQAALATRESFPLDDAEVQTFAANARRNQIQSQPVDVGSVKWSTPLPTIRVELPSRGEDGFERLTVFDRGPAALAQDVLAYYPLVLNNVVFYCDETAVYASELLSSTAGPQPRPAWGNEAAIYKLSDDQLGTPGPAGRRVGLPRFTMSIDGQRLFAHLGSSTTRARNRPQSGPAGVLVCLNLARQGDLVWNIKADELQEEGGRWTFDGAPLAVGGRVYVALRRREPQLQINIACLDAANAKLIWIRKVCLGLEHFGPDIAEIHHQLLTLADERLYYCTNRGAVAALNIHDGSPEWVTTYPRADIETASAFNKRQMHGPNPCVYHDGQVFVAPTDSDHILAYDAETGLLQWEREMKGNAHQLVGVVDDNLIAAGDQLWALDADEGRIAWIAGGTGPESATRGRCAIGGGMVYWPRREELLLVNPATGRIEREIDLKEQHGLAGGGNITLTDGFLLLGQTDRIVAFSEFGSLRRRREDQITRRPDDPRPQFELALLAEAENDPDLACEAYAKARELSKPEDVRDGLPLRELASRRLTQLLLRLGAAAMARKNEPESFARLTEAVDAAETPDLQVAAGRALAQAYDEAGEPGEAASAWQKLLDLSSANTNRAVGDFLSAAAQARKEIDRLIAVHGRGVYAPIELAAESELKEALRQRDLRQTAALVSRYPNAFAADHAALQLALLQRASGNSYGADRTFKQRLDASTNAEVCTAALFGLAQNAELRHGWRSARHWWQRLYDNHVGATVAIDGIMRPVHEVVSEKLERIDRLNGLSRKRPDDVAPFVRRWDRKLRSGSVVLVPEGSSPSDAFDCVLVAGPTLACHNVNDGNVRWRIALPESPTWAKFVSDVLILGTSTAAVGVVPDDGRILWQRSFAPDAGGAAEPHVSFRTAGDRLCCLSSATGIWSISPETGEVAWRYFPERGSIQMHWNCSPDRLVVQRLNPNRWDVLNAVDGSLVAEGPGPTMPWRDDPVSLPFHRMLAYADDAGLPQALNPKHGTIDQFGETPFAIANALADRASSDAALIAAIDSVTLARFDPLTGNKLWSCRAGVEPLHHPRGAACQDGERLYVVTAGVLHCNALDDGRLLWEQYVGPRGEWRVERAGPWIAAYRLAAADRTTIVLCDPASGEFAERINSDGPTRSVRFHAEADQAIVVTDTRLIGFSAVAMNSD